MEERSPGSPFASKQFTASSLVRNLTGSMALHPDKLPWSNAPVVGHYGSNADEPPYSYYLSGGGSREQQLQTHVSPEGVLPPPPYYNVKQKKMLCGCSDGVWEGDVGSHERDVTSCSFGRPEVEVAQGQLVAAAADLYGKRRGRRRSSGWIHRRSTSALRLDGSEEYQREEEEEKQELGVDQRFARPWRPTSFPLDDVAKFRSYVTSSSSSADVTLVPPPTIVSDCYTSSSGGVVGGIVVMATDSTPEAIP